MKLGIVSDLHCNIDCLTRALDIMGQIDELLCLGDSNFEYRFSNQVVALLKARGAHVTTEHALNDAPSGRASSPGRTSLPARSFARGQETKIAWKPPSVAVRFGETSQLGPNGEARLMLTIARSRAAPRASPKRPVNKASENSIAG